MRMFHHSETFSFSIVHCKDSFNCSIHAFTLYKGKRASLLRLWPMMKVYRCETPPQLFSAVHVRLFYSKLKSFSTKWKARIQQVEQPIIMVVLYVIECVMVREMLNEINISCISKAFTQTAFEPRQLHVFTLLCLVLMIKQYKSGIFLPICHSSLLAIQVP